MHTQKEESLPPQKEPAEDLYAEEGYISLLFLHLHIPHAYEKTSLFGNPVLLGERENLILKSIQKREARQTPNQ